MLRKLNTFNSQSQELNRMMDNLDLALNPVFNNEILDSNIVQSVALKIGTNVVNHKLGRAPIGWFSVRKRSPANLSDLQDTNKTPQLNYLIVSDAIAVVDIYFF